MDVDWDLLMWAGGIYSLLAAAWVFVDSQKRNLPRKKWAVFALLFPPLVPYYLKKTRPRKTLWYVILWGAGYFLCYSGVAQLAGSGEDQTVKTAADLLRRSQSSLSRAVAGLREEHPAGRFDSVSRIEEALEKLGLQIDALSGADAHVDEFLSYLAQYEDRIRAAGREDLILVKELFGDEFRSHQRGIRRYLNARREWLAYSRDNYGSILAREEPQNSVYEELYKEMEDAEASLKGTLEAYRAFLKGWIAGHPDPEKTFHLSEWLSGESE